MMSHRDYNEVVKRVEAVPGLELQVLGEVDGLPVLCASAGPRDVPTIYVNGGTHGDEPAGVEAALVFLESGIGRWRDRVRFEVVPCLSPWAYIHNSRLNAQGVDINWAFLRDDVSEVEVLKQFVEGKVFAGVLDLHEDWESPGFYLYEMFGERGPLGQAMVDAVAKVCPLNGNAEIEEEVAVNGVIHPNMEVAKRKRGEGIPIALYQRGYTGHLVTAESPTEKDMDMRVSAHLAVLEVMVEANI